MLNETFSVIFKYCAQLSLSSGRLKGNSSDTSVHRLRTQSVATMLIRPVPPNQCKSYPYLKANFTAAACQFSVRKALKISLLSIVHQIPLKRIPLEILSNMK